MMNILLLIIFLNYWLCYELLSRDLNSFSSAYIVDQNTFDQRFHHDFLIWLSIDLNIDFFSLNDWLNHGSILNFSSRSLNSFNSILGPVNRLSSHCIQIYYLILLGNQFNLLLIIYNLFLIDRLIINFSLRSLIFLSYYFFSVICRIHHLGMVYNLTILLLNIQLLFNNVFLRLNISLSNSGSSWNSNRNLPAHSL